MKLKPLIFIKSSQPLLAENYINELKEKLSGDNTYYSTYNYEETPINTILEDADSLSMFNKRKLIIVKYFKTKNKDDLRRLSEFSKNPSSFSTIVISMDNDQKIDKKLFHENTEFFEPEATKNLPRIIKEESNKIGLEIENSAIKTLISYVGEDLNVIKNELQKIAFFNKAKKNIEANDIVNFVNKSSFNDSFALVNSTASRNLKNSLKILNELERKQEDPISILNLLVWRFRQIFKLLELKNEKNSREIISKKLKISKGALYYLEKSSGNFKPGEVKTIFGYLEETDFKLKNSNSEKYKALHTLIVNICR